MWKSAHVRWLAGAWTVLWAVAWAVDALMGWDNAWPLLVPAVLTWRRLWSPSGTRWTREATGMALRRHADPGAELRDATEAHARESLARPRWPAWGLAVLSVVLGVACAVVGRQRGDGWDAAPAAVLLIVAVGVLVVDRAARRRARRWIDDPPYAEVDARR
ncbi:hypothetical protein DQ239_05310 [Blastococcus sp. TF02-09]|uniref:hypothetical protein n=1 Tax=Blastococcus sp. TF02-09 TaxID=2250576 RepID=UPI000DEA0AD8|nr:hypothetical protein [Blastococcus sp. TF02-9]RBY79087.1 hypothetical protein DQ239_05310 [Blastococcus sp. TF02-9]